LAYDAFLWLVHLASSVSVNSQVIVCLACLLVAHLASHACLTAYWFVLLALPACWLLIVPLMRAWPPIGLCCLPCLPVGCSSCHLCVPGRLLVCVACLACLLVAHLASYTCLTAYWFVLLPDSAYWLLLLPVMPAYTTVDSRLLFGWFCLLCMTIYCLVLPALPVCWSLFLPVMPSY
jgi:hypothetical protein